MKQKIIAQGAEAKIYQIGDKIVKDRISKKYRLKELDNRIRKTRTKKETKLLDKASKIINSPKPELSKNEFKIIMPYISGKKLSEHLDNLPNKLEVCKKIGESIAKLHHEDIIHGDLTTSNIILSEGKTFFIDFGLGFISKKIEDKAVDLHLIKQALEAKHYIHWENYWKEIESSYKKTYSKGKEVIERLKAVESRGRYKEKY